MQEGNEISFSFLSAVTASWNIGQASQIIHAGIQRQGYAAFRFPVSILDQSLWSIPVSICILTRENPLSFRTEFVYSGLWG